MTKQPRCARCGATVDQFGGICRLRSSRVCADRVLAQRDAWRELAQAVRDIVEHGPARARYDRADSAEEVIRKLCGPDALCGEGALP